MENTVNAIFKLLGQEGFVCCGLPFVDTFMSDIDTYFDYPRISHNFAGS